MKILHEAFSYFRFLELVDSKKEIIFYAEDEESYFHFKGIINYLTQNLKFPVVYITSKINDKIFDKESDLFKVFYFDKLLPIIIKNLKSKVIIMTMPDLDVFHIKRSKHCNNHIYIFHNIGSSFTAIRFGALFNYDTLFCVGEHHEIETKKQENYYKLKNKNLVKFGYNKLELIIEQYKDYNYKKNSNGKRILIAPSWGENSILNYCGKELIDNLLNNDYVLIVRPHPMTFKKHNHVILELLEHYNNSNNFSIEQDISSTDSFYNADLLITDWSGVAYEYAFGTEKPILFIDVPQKLVNDKFEEINLEPIDIKIRYKLGEVVSPHELNKIDFHINKLINQRDKYISKIIEARNSLVYNLGNSSQVGAEYIQSLIK